MPGPVGFLIDWILLTAFPYYDLICSSMLCISYTLDLELNHISFFWRGGKTVSYSVVFFHQEAHNILLSLFL